MHALREPERAAPRADPFLSTPADPLATRSEGDGWLACRACGQRVAEARDRIEVNGAHAHSFINPEGAIYRVGCFAAAAGVLPWGEPNRYFTWFAGFDWRVAGCRRCGTHLGWTYAAGAASFVALILDRLGAGGCSGSDEA